MRRDYQSSVMRYISFFIAADHITRLTGSAWSEYKKSQTVHGIPMPAGLQESEKFPKPIFTPSTKADLGEHDENIHPDKGGWTGFGIVRATAMD